MVFIGMLTATLIRCQQACVGMEFVLLLNIQMACRLRYAISRFTFDFVSGIFLGAL